jgi:hypothetical protein
MTQLDTLLTTFLAAGPVFGIIIAIINHNLKGEHNV